MKFRHAKLFESTDDKVVTWTGGSYDYDDVVDAFLRIDRLEMRLGTSEQSGKTKQTFFSDREGDAPTFVPISKISVHDVHQYFDDQFWCTGKCFDSSSFECIDFQGLSQIIASFTRESLAEREAGVCNFPWTQKEKYCFGEAHQCSVFTLYEDGHSLDSKDKSGRRPFEY